MLWQDGYLSNYGSQGSGTTTTGYTNYSPRAWFGPYDSKRFDMVRETLDRFWSKRIKNKNLVFTCRSSKHSHCVDKDYIAKHLVVDYISLCPGWFNMIRLERHRNLVHEMFHNLRIPGTGEYVQDSHDFWRASCKYRPAKALYGDDAAYVANHGGCKDRNYKRAVRTNDNYAYAVTLLGDTIYRERTPTGAIFTRFPARAPTVTITAPPNGSQYDLSAWVEFRAVATDMNGRRLPDLRFDETDHPHRTASGHQVAWRWRMRGTMSGPLDPPGFAPTGRAMEIEGVDLWTMRDARIARYRALPRVL